MTILNKLASSLHRRDEEANQLLAEEIVKANDAKAIAELVENLNNKSRDIQNDCIKVLYEIGERKPALIASYLRNFVGLLENKNNRLQWGAMTALDAIATEDPGAIFKVLTKIIVAAEGGSVITRDHAVNILVKLCAVKQYSDTAFPFLIEQIQRSPSNQLPMYAEKAMPFINEKNRPVFIKTLNSRLDDIDKDTKRKRVEKVIAKLQR